MSRLVDCLTLEHDASLLLLAGMLCILGCLSCLVVAGRALSVERPLLWMSLLSLSAGCTAWSTHFVAMLAYRMGVPITYDPSTTVLSLVVGIVIVSMGFMLAYYWRALRLMRVLGGAVVGSGVAALHYIGMSGLRFPGTMSHDQDLVGASLVFSVSLGAAAIDRLFQTERRGNDLLAASLLMLMILSLHFLAMSAARIDLDTFDSTAGVSRSFLVIGVTLSSLTVLTIGTVAALFDLRVSAKLATQAERFRMLADGAFEGLIVHRDMFIVDSNRAGRKLLGLEGRGRGRHLSDWSFTESMPLEPDSEPLVEEITISCATGASFPAEICRRAILLQDGTRGELIAIRDLTQRKESEARIAHLALHDTLTNLPNRRFFTELANNAITHAKRANSSFALLVMDLNQFKAVNDLHGHAAGDKLIEQVAKRMDASLTDGDIVARLGGDEFSLISTSADQPTQALALARLIHRLLETEIVVGGTRLTAAASIGIAVYPGDGTSIEALMRHADTAMYAAKSDSTGSTRFFEASMNIELEARRKLESRLRVALEHDALSLHYQPLVTSTDHSPVCFEALLRWCDSELGPVSPAEFIPVAEQTGLIVPIGEFVLQQACRDAVTWPEPMRVAVNLSVAQFGKHDVVGMVRTALESSGLSGDRLELEITESLLIENREQAVRTLDELKALGVRIAMDDFGTGYSSLSYLQSFGFNKLKIDRAFVSNLASSPENASIVEAVVSMGKSLHMRVVAEGVETSEQAAILSALQCDELQGYLIARPMPAADIPGFLERIAGGTTAGEAPDDLAA